MLPSATVPFFAGVASTVTSCALTVAARGGRLLPNPPESPQPCCFRSVAAVESAVAPDFVSPSEEDVTPADANKPREPLRLRVSWQRAAKALASASASAASDFATALSIGKQGAGSNLLAASVTSAGGLALGFERLRGRRPWRNRLWPAAGIIIIVGIMPIVECVVTPTAALGVGHVDHGL